MPSCKRGLQWQFSGVNVTIKCYKVIGEWLLTQVIHIILISCRICKKSLTAICDCLQFLRMVILLQTLKWVQFWYSRMLISTSRQYLYSDRSASRRATPSSPRPSCGTARFWLHSRRRGERKVSILRQKAMLNCSLVANSGSFWLISLMTLISAFLRKTRYSFSYFSQYSRRVLQVLSYLGFLRKESQLVKPNQLFLLSASCLMTFSTCLNSRRESRPRLRELSCRQWLFSIKQYMNLQKFSWLTNTSQFLCYSFDSNLRSEELLWLLLRLDETQPFTSTTLFLEVLRSQTLGVDFWSLPLFLRPVWYSSSDPLVLAVFRSVLPTEQTLGLRFCSSDLPVSLKLIKLVKFCMLISRNSSRVMRSSLLTAHILARRYLMLGVTLYFSGTAKGVELILRISSFSLLHSQGVMPTIISYRMTPTAKMSLSGEQLFRSSDYSGMYSGVPTLCRVFVSIVALMANPKSPSFQFLAPLKMLAGFTSRWTTPMRKRYLTASTTSPMTATASFSQSLPCLVTYSRRSPWGQYSVTRQQWVAVRQTFSKRRMLGWARRLRMSISLSSISRLEEEYFFSSITFTAQSSSSLLLRQRYTWLVQPEPISSLRRYVNGPIDSLSSLNPDPAFPAPRFPNDPASRNFRTPSFSSEFEPLPNSQGEKCR